MCLQQDSSDSVFMLSKSVVFANNSLPSHGFPEYSCKYTYKAFVSGHC